MTCIFRDFEYVPLFDDHTSGGSMHHVLHGEHVPPPTIKDVALTCFASSIMLAPVATRKFLM